MAVTLTFVTVTKQNYNPNAGYEKSGKISAKQFLKRAYVHVFCHIFKY